MDHWSNLNLNQAYTRLPTTANAASLNRFDLHLLEQQGFATAGLGAAAGLSSPLPAHATLSPAAAAARSFTAGLPHVNYSALPMAPLFDSMAQLTQNFAAASQVPYRAAMQGVTAQPTVYAIDSTGHPVSSAGRFVASIVAATTGGNNDSQQKTVSLFNTDPHTMADPVAPSVGSIAAQPSSSSSQTVYGSRTSGHAAPANPYAGLPTNYATGVSGSDRYTGKNTGSVTAAEPPPAHSGSRPSTNARAPSYPTKEFAQPAIAVQRPQQPTTTAQNRDIPPRTAYTPVEQRSVETNPPTAHSNLQRPGDDLMQKLLLSYGPRGQVQAVGAGRTPPTSFTNSSPVQSAQALATVGRSQNQNYVDPSRGQRAGTSAYQNYSIGSPIQYAPSGYAQPPDDVMEELSYDDVSSPEGMGLQDAAASLAGAYMQASSSIGNKASAVVRSDGTVVHEDAARHVVQSCPAQTAQRQTSIVLGRVGAIPDPTIQAQADSTTRPKKGGGTGRTARSATGEAGTERGGKRSRSGSSRSRVKGKTEDDVASAGVQHRAPEMSVPDLGSYGNPAAYAQLLPTDFGTAAGQGYVATDAFAQYRVTSDPYQVAAAECMIATAARPDMTQHRMTAVSAPVDALNRTDTSSVQQEAQVFMTNMFGSAFVNPNELLAVEQIAFVDPNDAAAYTAQVTTVPKQDPKHRPIIEEEFGHLAEDPTVNASSTPSAAPADSARQLTPGTSGVANNLEQPKTLPEAKPVKPPQSAAFMDSFLNFLQGKKPETLTSVSTSVVTKKPVLPKYIPEPPRPKPPPPPPQPAVPAAPAVTPKPGTSTEKTKDTIVVQFSDEEDEEEPLSKHTGSNIASAVNKALLSLKVDSAATTKTTSRGAASTASAAAAGKQRGRPSKSSPAGSTTVKVTTPSKPAAKRPKMLKRGSKHVDGGVLSDDDADVVVLDSPMVTPRERSTRKAKEVASQRRRMPSVQKGKRGVAIIFNSDSEESPDDVEPDSDDDVRSTHEKGYDSDKDPAWKPNHITQSPVKKISVTLSSGSEDEGGRAVRGSGRGRSRGRGRGRASAAKTQSTRAVSGQTSAPAMIKTGRGGRSKSVEKAKALKNDVVNDKTTDDEQNSSNSTSTSTEATLTDLAVNRSEPESEAVQESFSVYVQICVSQALEPTFLTALLEQPDAYYIDPLQKIDSLLFKKKQFLASQHQWTPDFMTSLEKFSTFIFKDGVEPNCFSEATSNRVDPATRRVRFGGFFYGAEKLDNVIEVDEDAAREFLLTSSESDVLPVLHGVHHLKFSLLQACQVKVAKLKETSSGVPDDQILDICMRDQSWMQQMFDRLSSLLS